MSNVEEKKTTLFAVYNAKSPEVAEEYEKYLVEKKIALVESMPYIISYEIYRIDSIFGPGVANPQNLPTDLPYQFVAKIEVTSIEDFVNAEQTPEAQAFIKEYSAFIDPSTVFTIGHRLVSRE